MTEKLFYKDPYARKFEGRVISCEEGKKGWEVVLDKTVFYPEGGGQPGDTGYLGKTRVLDTIEREGQLIHICDSPLEKGSATEGRIDWERRFMLMQQHTGEHIYSGIVHRIYGYDNVGFHMGKDCITVDFNGALTWEQAICVEKEANAVIFADEAVSVSFPDRQELEKTEYRSKKELEGQVRIVTVPGADVCACCGLHVAGTGEAGCIKTVSLINYKGGVRIGLLIGWSALYDYEEKTEGIRRISNLLSSKPQAVPEAVEKLYQTCQEQKQEINGLKRQIFAMRAEQVEKGTPLIYFIEDGMTPVEARQFCDMLAERAVVAAVFSGNDENGYKYAVVSHSSDVRPIGKALAQRCMGRGGGSAELVQGSASGDSGSIEECMRLFS